MPTNFPTSLDTLTNPTSTDNLNTTGVLHDEQHANSNDAIEALEAKVGINSSAVSTSLDYKIARRQQTSGGGLEDVNTNATSGATPSIDLANGNVHVVTLTANATFTFTGSTTGKGCSFTLILKQDATGSRTTTWPSSVDWNAGAAPTLSTAANAVDVLTFLTVDGGTIWYGFLAGKGMA